MIQINKEVSRLKKAFPNNKMLNLLDEFKKLKRYKTYEGALDAFAFKFGLGMVCPPLENSKGKFVGYVPMIKYYPDNALNFQNETEKFTPNKSLGKCYEYLTKEIIYRLMRVESPEKYL